MCGYKYKSNLSSECPNCGVHAESGKKGEDIQEIGVDASKPSRSHILGISRKIWVVIILLVVGGAYQVIDELQTKTVLVYTLDSEDLTATHPYNDYWYVYDIDYERFVLPENTDSWTIEVEWWRYDGKDEHITSSGSIYTLDSDIWFSMGFTTEYRDFSLKSWNSGKKEGSKVHYFNEIDHTKKGNAGSARGNYWLSISTDYSEFKITITADTKG